MPVRLDPHRPRLLLAVLLGVACSGRDDAPAPVPAGDAEAAAAASEEGEAALRLRRSIELERQGDLEGARVEADAAVAAGGGRDATLQAAKLAILGQRYDDAAGPLDALVKADPTDAAAQYDLALVRHHQGDYNRARNGYLAALRADPRHADARYNLAVLCSSHGVLEEARHHVARFRASFPDDARGPELERRIGGTGAAGPTGAGPASGPTPGGDAGPASR
jgi:tetratricopeptide (TPR) repeat protein